jgi:hypothetical protein
MRVKIKIKNKLEDKPEVSIGGLNWNEKYLWLKKKQIKRMRVKLEKKKNNINFDWMMKLKTNKTLTKKLRKKN